MAKIKYFIPAIAFLGLSLLLWRGLYLNPRELPSMLIDKPLPEFAMVTVEEEAVDNASLPNQMFSAQCMGQLLFALPDRAPTLMRLAEEGEIPVVGVNYKDRRELAEDWLETNGNPFEFSIYDDEGRLGIDLGVYGAPETYLVDANGVIRYRHVAVLDEQVWADVFEPAIAELRGESR